MKIRIPHYTIKFRYFRHRAIEFLVIHISFNFYNQYCKEITGISSEIWNIFTRYPICLWAVRPHHKGIENLRFYGANLPLHFMVGNGSLADSLSIYICLFTKQESLHLILKFLTNNFTNHTLYIAHTNKLWGFIAIIFAAVQRIHLPDGFMSDNT